jgi:mono/diheme cytochrome c family protein
LRADRRLLAGVAALLALGCHQKMREQPRCEPLGPSRLFADGKCAREPVRGTVARGAARDPLATLDPKSDRLPVPVTPALVVRGRERYDIYCSPCHDRVGTGRGMIVQRGFRAPPSLHDERLRTAPVGHFVDVMTHGWGAMPAYAAQVPVVDRWAIALYVRALQRSQHASPGDVPADARAALGGTP